MQTLIGIFSHRTDAEHAVVALEQKGYDPKEISFVLRDEDTIGKTTTIGSKGGHATYGALSGAATGGIIGGLAGLLVGVGIVTIPGIGPFFVAGPLAAALGLSGATAGVVSGIAGGLFAGGIMGALTGLGMPEEEAKIYEEKIQKGGVLLAVPIHDRIEVQEIRKLYEQNGAEQVRTLEMG